MIFEKALKLLKEGKKVRRKEREKGEFEAKPNIEIPENERKAFEEGFEAAEMLWKEKIEEALRRLLK